MDSQPRKLSVKENCSLVLVFLWLPAVLIYNALTARWSSRNKGKPSNRVLFDSTARYITSHVSIRQMQKLSGTTFAAYRAWAAQVGITPAMEELDHDARLLWVGPIRTDRVLIYCHGGGFMGPLSDFQLSFWKNVQEGLLTRPNGKEIGIAVLEYSIHPTSFPTQLIQLVSAIQHLLSKGLHPSHLHLAGDSAGANLILQLLSHALHPLPDINPAPKGPFRGACLISPWVAISSDSESFKTNKDLDIVTPSCLLNWAKTYLSSVPESHYIYVQASAVTENWFAGVDNLVDRILITAGGNEVLKDNVLELSENLKTVHQAVRVELQPGAVHADPIFDVAARSKELSPITEMIIDWLAEGCADKPI